MNETNFPENQLRSWQPHRPSAGLKRRIWRASQKKTTEVGMYLRWLAPAAACVLLAISAVRQSDDLFRATAHVQPVTVMLASNQLAYVPVDNSQQGHNRLQAVTFEWTNRSSSTSSIGSFLPGKAN